MSRTTEIRIAITGAAVALLVVHLIWPNHQIDKIPLGLALLAILPWASSIIESAKLPGGWEVRFRQVESGQAKQGLQIDLIMEFLLENFVTQDELVHLRKLARGESFPFTRSPSFEAELRRLLSLKLLERKEKRGIRSLFNDGDDVTKSPRDLRARSQVPRAPRRACETRGVSMCFPRVSRTNQFQTNSALSQRTSVRLRARGLEPRVGAADRKAPLLPTAGPSFPLGGPPVPTAESPLRDITV